MKLVPLDIDKEFPPNLCQNKTSVFQFELTHKGVDNARLAQFILELEKKKGSSWRGSLRGGWHSDKRLFQRHKETFQHLHDIIKTCAMKILNSSESSVKVTHSWANIIQKGHYNDKHSHGHYPLVACYYVSTDTAQNGVLPPAPEPSATRNPVGVAPERRPSEGAGGLGDSGGEFVATCLKIAPKPGMLLIFPGNMDHEVLKYKGVKPRISIACNIRL